jgi:hypothetical protein
VFICVLGGRTQRERERREEREIVFKNKKASAIYNI